MHQNGYIGRKMRQPKLKDKEAIVIAAFGSSSRAKHALDIFHDNVRQEFPEHEIFRAYTSDIIRKQDGTPGLQETLAKVESMGFRRAVVQPLHVFPGTEYCQMAETCHYFPGLRVFLGETLLHRWEFIIQTLKILEQDFFAPEEGLNILALHGTPLAADPVNVVYLGLEKLVRDRYPNVIAASIEGVPDQHSVFNRLRRENISARYPKVRIIPMMYIAGLHAEEDLMGDEEGSWRVKLKKMGCTVECAMVSHDNALWFKGLAWFPEIQQFYLNRLQRILELAVYF